MGMNAERNRVVAVYRPCPCGETAHDYVGGTVSGVPWTKAEHGGTATYACRNCRRRISVRKREDAT
jgi:hypothetical protein